MPRRSDRRAAVAPWRDGPIRDPRLGSGLSLPVSWADGRYVPPPSAFCACCRGTQFSRGSSGWVCCVCHPATGKPTETIDTSATSKEGTQ